MPILGGLSLAGASRLVGLGTAVAREPSTARQGRAGLRRHAPRLGSAGPYVPACLVATAHAAVRAYTAAAQLAEGGFRRGQVFGQLGCGKVLFEFNAQ